MNLLKKLFGSGIVDDNADEYREHTNAVEMKLADSRQAMYRAVLRADHNARVFRNAAGEMRMIRGNK
jgi:hypothetical protein